MPNDLSRLYQIGWSALRARQFEMDTISDNLSNVNTPGFKARRAGFQAELRLQEAEWLRRGVEDGTSTIDTSQGPTQETGQDWDLAIDGPGFFIVGQPDGTAGYTRVGTFHADSAGRVVNESGLPLAPGLTLPEGAELITIDGQGAVTATVGGIPQAVGQIQLARFANPDSLVDSGGGIYVPSAATSQPTVAAPGSNGVGRVLSGALETSNVNMSQELLDMVRAQKGYGMSLKALQVSDQMAQITNQLPS